MQRVIGEIDHLLPLVTSHPISELDTTETEVGHEVLAGDIAALAIVGSGALDAVEVRARRLRVAILRLLRQLLVSLLGGGLGRFLRVERTGDLATVLAKDVPCLCAGACGR